MKPTVILFRVIISIIGVIVLSFNVLLYNFCKQQKIALTSMSDQQKVETQVNSNRFKYQQDQIEHLGKDLEDAQGQIKNQNDTLADQKDALAAQKDAFLQEVEKRQQIENQNKSIQTSLIDIKAEADAIKQDMKGWQKDYVAVLAELEKKIDDSQDEIKSLDNNLTALNIPELKEDINSLKADVEKIAHPSDNSVPGTPSESEKKIEHIEMGSQ